MNIKQIQKTNNYNICVSSSLKGNISFKGDTKRTDTSSNADFASREACEGLKSLAFAKMSNNSSELDNLDRVVSSGEKAKVLVKTREEFPYYFLSSMHDAIENLGQLKVVQLILNKTEDEGQDYIYKDTEQILGIVNACKNPDVSEIALNLIEENDISFEPEIFVKMSDLKNNSKDKFDYVINSNYLLRYLDSTLSLASYGPRNLIDEMDVDEFPKMEKIMSDVANKYGNKRYIKSMVDLYYINQDVYDYAMSSDVLLKDFFAYSRSFETNEILTVNTLKMLEESCRANTGGDKNLRAYVYDSDVFNNEDKLNKYLSQFVVKDDFEVYRCDRNTGLFENISIDHTPLGRKARRIIHSHPFKFKKDLIIPNDKKYFTSDKKSLHEYFSGKKNLTLSDAMLIAKYGDDKYLNDLYEAIKNAEVIDERFKSSTLSKKFADNWSYNNNDKTAKMKSRLLVKKGCEGAYDTSRTGQFEYILNNHPKKIKYHDVKFDRENNIFELIGTVEKN
ncbi:MAG: hypothetical protein E7Z91_04690 [Cyanobacteria bacterium SIG30]|nr:hypothetical protein [Cyanobacteria bacterium SIG30]